MLSSLPRAVDSFYPIVMNYPRFTHGLRVLNICLILLMSVSFVPRYVVLLSDFKAEQCS